MSKEFVIGSDHAGFSLKEEMKKYLASMNYDVIDVGPPDDRRIDYPDVAQSASKIVLSKNIQGLIICGTGIGVSIACNKVDGIRCGLVHDEYTSEMCRAHNDANMLAFGARVILQTDLAKRILQKFLSTSFEGGRHSDRVKKLIIKKF